MARQQVFLQPQRKTQSKLNAQVSPFVPRRSTQDARSFYAQLKRDPAGANSTRFALDHSEHAGQGRKPDA